MKRVINLLVEALIVGLAVVYMIFVCVSCYVYISSSHQSTPAVNGTAIIEAYKRGASDGIEAVINLQKKQAAEADRET
jgi:hypothetical protein